MRPRNTIEVFVFKKNICCFFMIWQYWVVFPNSSFYQMENAIHKSSCIMILFQLGLDSTRSNMLLQLYSQLIKETCFNVLRTKEQLGYIVFSGVWRQGGVHGLQFIVQSHKKPKFLDSRIENFIKETRETIKVSK